ncbi:MAG TPA: TetR/AcrR family transcriptional regulator C-terminal domain-containing protein [Acidimicrobiia bacterium]|jgi:AcrR family transcriptional regulator
MSTDTNPVTRVPLSRSRVLRAAVGLADRGGIKSLTMRNLAQELGVEAMSLYYHVANKDEILDGVAELVVEDVNEAVGAISGPSAQDDWKTVMRARILTARDVFLRHPWAPGLLESRNAMSPATVRYFNGLLGIFRQGGFSYDLAHHAMHALGSRAMGFAQEMFEPDTEDGGDDAATAILEEMADQLPYIVEMMMEVAHDDPDSTLGWCDDQTEFEFGLDLILDGLERLRDKP